ncbi:MAG: restriction endonuclease subunit S [bacterium]|nr:restriction endonuclease subunit S [bacterium]
MRPYLNKVHEANQTGACSAEFLVFPSNPYLNSSFLRFLLHNRAFVRFAAHPDKMTGDRPRIDFDDIKGYQFLLPPLDEQARIVERIEQLFQQVEEGEKALKAAQKLVEKYRISLLKAAVTGELTKEWREKNPPKETGADLLKRILKARREAWEAAELEKFKAKGQPPKDDAWKKKYQEPALPSPEAIADLPELPEGWVWASLDQLAWASSYGTSVKCSYDSKGIKVLRVPNIRPGRFDVTDIKLASIDLEISAAERVQQGDLLFVRTNGSKAIIGAGVVACKDLDDEFYYASYLIRFRLVASALPFEWVNLVWQSPVVRGFIHQNAATSAGQYNISQSKVQELPIPLPPSEEAVEISSLAKAKLDLFGIQKELAREQAGVLALRQSILKDAFSGKLVPQDPEDEPASVLLERIQAERAAREAEAKPKKPRGRKKKGTA